MTMEPAESKAQRFEPEDHPLQRKTPNMVANYSFPCETRTPSISSGEGTSAFRATPGPGKMTQ